jgi:uncharacterized protein YndB with AHSA1/START domain
VLHPILIALAVIVAGFLIFVATRPSDFRITRSAVISAPPSAVFDRVNDLHRFQEWSPWIEMDPAARTTYAGPPAGTGAIFNWAGNKNVGEGSMTITESRPSELVRFKLDFLKPFPSTSTAEFTFKPEGRGTQVTWSMFGQHSFVPKALFCFMNMDKMVGGQFEKGLAKLKLLSESAL